MIIVWLQGDDNWTYTAYYCHFHQSHPVRSRSQSSKHPLGSRAETMKWTSCWWEPKANDDVCKRSPPKDGELRIEADENARKFPFIVFRGCLTCCNYCVVCSLILSNSLHDIAHCREPPRMAAGNMIFPVGCVLCFSTSDVAIYVVVQRL